MMNMHVNMIFAGHSDRLYMPTFHKDINDINVGRYRGIILVDEDKEKRRVTITRHLQKQTNETPEDVCKIVRNQPTKFLKELHQKLKYKVYDQEDTEMIKKIRCLTDLKNILLKIRAKGPVLTSSLEWDNFLKHAKSIVHTIRDVPDEELKIQYRSFVEKIQDHYNDIKRDDLDKLTSIGI
jgi:hypothetical protein